ncbi:MAG TPA: polysaccharide deacetylase family protein [Ktedonobacterales bacterium]
MSTTPGAATGVSAHDVTIPILMYHSISTSTNPLFSEWAVPPAMFEEHMAFLRRSGYTPITVSDLVRARAHGAPLPANPVVLTFDDAYADFYENAYPILRLFGAPATLYVPTAWVGGACDWLAADGESSRSMVTWSQLAEMSAGGIECGGHSHRHVQMDILSEADAREEIVTSKRLLDEHLGQETGSFAYPHGWTSRRVKRLVKAAGYTSACAVKNMHSAMSDDPFALARLHVRGDMDVAALGALIDQRMTSVEATLRGVARFAIRFGPRARARLGQLEARASVAQRPLAPLMSIVSIVRAPQTAPTRPFEPAAMLEIELSEPIPHLAEISRSGVIYRRALALIRLHAQPLRVMEFALDGGAAGVLAQRIWEELGDQINAHLSNDGLAQVCGLAREGIATGEEPACLAARRAFLPRAPFVSVVIPTHNRPAQVAALVETALASDYPAERFEVIVVDNAPSTNETALLFNRDYMESARVRYVREDRAGSSNARNAGLALARGEIVVFADDDELVDQRWLGEMVRGFESASDVRCVTGLVMPMELETQAQGWFEQFGGYCKAGFSARLFNLTDHRAESPLYPYNLGIYGAGGSMAFKRDHLLGIGGFDPALGPATPTLGGEDLDAMLRTVLGGHTLAYAPTAIVRHPSHREIGPLRKQMRGYGLGLSSALFKTFITQPRRAPEFLARLPLGLQFAFGAESPHHAGKQVDYPKELTWLEMRGLVAGPFAYLRSRRRIAAATRAQREPLPQTQLAHIGQTR